MEISVSVAAGAATISINRPEKRNALTLAMYHALAEAITAADVNPDIRAIVLTGSGGSFSAGNDLGDFLAKSDPTAVRSFQEAVLATSTVLVAAVDGPAVGIGATVLLHCDLVYATERSYLQFPFVDLGLIPEFGSSLLLPRLVGARHAAEIFLLGERIPAPKAATLGIINEVLPTTEALTTRISEQTTKLARKPAEALQATRALLRDTDGQTPHERLVTESTRFKALLDNPETTARLQAILNK